MILTKILALLVLCATPEVGTVETPVVSDVMEKPFVTVRYSADVFDAERRSELAEMVDASFDVDVKFQTVGGDGVVEVVTDSDGVDLKKVIEFVKWFVEWDPCDD